MNGKMDGIQKILGISLHKNVNDHFLRIQKITIQDF